MRVEAYTLEGIVTGAIEWPGHLRDALDAAPDVQMANATFVPIDGRPAEPGANRVVAVDDIVIAVPDEAIPNSFHVAWHEIRLEAGPYLLRGELATMPGFDPSRALARPTGTFVLLRDVHVELLGATDGGTNVHAEALVNRYNVDAVDADLMLGFFFPGARMEANVAPGSTAGASSGPPHPAGPRSHDDDDRPVSRREDAGSASATATG